MGALGSSSESWEKRALELGSRTYVVSNLLLPLTKQDRMSYAEIAGPSPVNWFYGSKKSAS